MKPSGSGANLNIQMLDAAFTRKAPNLHNR
jgi:hypothetical protein